MTSVTPLRRCSAALVSALLIATPALTGCDGGGDPDPDEPAATSGSSGATDPSESDGTTEPTEPAADTPLGTGAEPASGKQLDYEALSVRLPEGWVTGIDGADGFTARPKELALDELSVRLFENYGDTTALPRAARDAIEDGGYPTAPRQLDPVEVDGVEMFHLSGKVQKSTWVEAFGSNSTRWDIRITFLLDPERSEEEQLALADSVLATIDLK